MAYDPREAAVILAAENRARDHHEQYDPSHDFWHVDRVRRLSLSIAHHSTSSAPLHRIDLLVVELAALFHDLIDAKYLPKGSEATDAKGTLEPFWRAHGAVVAEDRRRLVEQIVDNVSFSKEVKRIKAGGQTEWHLSCPELHCVQDADKLDAIGAFGIMRCAAYSAIANRPLFLPPTPPTTDASATASHEASPAGSSALDHFDDKLFKLEGMMKTERGKELARRRTETMRQFVDDAKREWQEAVGADVSV